MLPLSTEQTAAADKGSQRPNDTEWITCLKDNALGIRPRE